MSVKLNSTGGGSVTLDSPSTASNYTVTLPSAAGTLATTTGSLASPTITGTVAGGATYTSPTLTGASITAANSNTVEATSGPTSTQLAGNRNKVINGGMAIDQRNAGAAVTTDGAFPVDRFQTYPGGTGSGQRIAMSNPPEVSGFAYYLKFIRTGSGSSYSYVSQKIENIKYLSGKQMTFSFYIRGDVINASGFTVWSEAFKDDGTFIGYSPNCSTSFAITSTWTRVSMRMDVPVISVDPGTGGGFFRTYLRCTGPTENFNISTTGWQWEEGTVATPFENRLYGTELALCQRYYQKSYSQGTTPGAIQDLNKQHYGATSTSANINNNDTPFCVTMRTSPTMTVYNPTTGATGTARNFSASTDLAAAFYDVGDQRGMLQINVAVTAVGNVLTYHWTAVAEL